MPLLKYVTDASITATLSKYSSQLPSEARMSGGGWCADSTCPVGSESHYLQVDFGTEVVVEAIAIGSDYTVYQNYVTKYYVEYGSDENQGQYAIPEDSNGIVSYVFVSIKLSIM